MFTEDYYRAVLAGALLNSALYLAGCFVAGILFDVPAAWKLAVAGAGFAFLSYMSAITYAASHKQFLAHAASGLSVVSVIVGAAAGLSLLGG